MGQKGTIELRPEEREGGGLWEEWYFDVVMADEDDGWRLYGHVCGGGGSMHKDEVEEEEEILLFLFFFVSREMKNLGDKRVSCTLNQGVRVY